MADNNDTDELAKRRRKRSEQMAAASPQAEVTNTKTSKAEPQSATVLGFDRNENFAAGSQHICRVTADEPGGYALTVIQSQTLAFLPTQHCLEIGAQIQAQFVCYHKGRVLMSARFVTGKDKLKFNPLTEVASSDSENELQD